MTCLYSFRNKYGNVCGCGPLGLTSLARRWHDDGCGPPAAAVAGTSGNLGRFVPVIRAHLLDAPQLQADPPFAFGEIGGAFAIFAARPKRHAVGLAQGAHYVFVSALLLRIVGSSIGNGLEREDIRVLDPRHLPRTIGL